MVLENDWRLTVEQHLQRANISRRTVLQLLTATGVIAAGGYGLSEYAPWLDFEAQANRIRTPILEDRTMTSTFQELIRHATLAANGHNAQAWRFLIK